jgi:hypothetical protein
VLVLATLAQRYAMRATADLPPATMLGLTRPARAVSLRPEARRALADAARHPQGDAIA